jgi:hypothetical protein
MGRPKKGDTSLQDKIIEHMFNVLPATTVGEITERLQRKIPAVKHRRVEDAIRHLRKNVEKYGYTIPHVGGNYNRTDRYFALLVERDGSYYFDDNPGSLDNLDDGSKAIISRIATESSNQATVARVAAGHTKKRNKRNALLDLAADVEYVARKAKALIRDWDEAA